MAAKLPHPWGLYDLQGNVWEWVQDGDGDDAPTPGTAPAGPAAGPAAGRWRRMRRGSWYYADQSTPAACRHAALPHPGDPYLGCRLVRTH